MAVRNDFSSGEVLTAADLNDTFASKVDYATPTNAQTGTAYTFVADDAERLTTASNGSAVTFTIPPQSSVTWGDDTILRVVNYGAGAVTVDGGSGVTVTNTATTVAQYQAAAAIRTGSDAWTLVPFAGGGEIPAAEISSPAATGQYTDTGVTYDYYTFTASGTLTVDTAGFADVLIVGGGGAGGVGRGGGGGAGGHLYITDAYLPAGSLTVTVGAGGVAPAPQSTGEPRSGNTGIASRLDSYFAPGGGGGGGSEIDGAGSFRLAGIGTNGGSGGGSSGYQDGSAAAGGAGITNLGNNGGQGVVEGAAGGGGAGAAGSNGSGDNGGNGGAGTANSVAGSSVTRAGGGGGAGAGAGTNGTGGSGGGGDSADSGTADSGDANTGGGGGGAANFSQTAGAGGSGVVIVRVKV